MNKLRKKNQQVRSQDSIEFIIQATHDLLKSQSYSELSTNKIAKRAGVSIGTLYIYFKSKEHLLLTIIEREFYLNYKRIGLLMKDRRGQEPLKVIEDFFHFLFLEDRTWNLICHLINDIPTIEKIFGDPLFSNMMVEFINQELVDTFGKTLSKEHRNMGLILFHSVRSNMVYYPMHFKGEPEQVKKQIAKNLSRLFLDLINNLK